MPKIGKWIYRGGGTRSPNPPERCSNPGDTVTIFVSNAPEPHGPRSPQWWVESARRLRQAGLLSWNLRGDGSRLPTTTGTGDRAESYGGGEVQKGSSVEDQRGGGSPLHHDHTEPPTTTTTAPPTTVPPSTSLHVGRLRPRVLAWMGVRRGGGGRTPKNLYPA